LIFRCPENFETTTFIGCQPLDYGRRPVSGGRRGRRSGARRRPEMSENPIGIALLYNTISL